jgi:methionyl-tRNA synthetase
MSKGRRFHITTAIPYVNGDPHLGHALGSCRPMCLLATGACAATTSGGGFFAMCRATLVAACRTIARELGPFLPSAAERIGEALDEWDEQRGRALFAKFGSVA